jgi:hypothetical protein
MLRFENVIPVFTSHTLQIVPVFSVALVKTSDSVAIILGQINALPGCTSVSTDCSFSGAEKMPRRGHTSHQGGMKGVIIRNLLGRFNSACTGTKALTSKRNHNGTVHLNAACHFSAIIRVCATQQYTCLTHAPIADTDNTVHHPMR